MPENNVFAGPYLEREGHLRVDPAWLESALADPRSRVLPVWNSLNLVTDALGGGTSGGRPNGAADAPTLRAAFLDIEAIAPQRRPDLVLLGRRDGTDYLAYEAG